jgi:CBS domain-containing protein
MRLGDLIVGKPQYVVTGQTIEHAAKRIVDHGLSLLPVCRNDGRVVGLITPLEIVKSIAQDRAPELCAVDDVMTKDFPVCSVEDATDEVYTRMVTESISAIVVLHGGKLAGVLPRSSLATLPVTPARATQRQLRRQV